MNTEDEGRKAVVKFSDGTEMTLEGVTASKPQMIKHYNQFSKIFMRNHGLDIHVVGVEFLDEAKP